ncbi:MAG TPA: DegT/DnrJ/EryC1/StrS family aminotransferase [Terriglobia bacterium]|nr:DegT/DnrJ/EryC1/StrS family aminotransferase [Terriglobia bacterium]
MNKQIEEKPRDCIQMAVPFMDLRTEHQRHRGDLLRAWEEILDSSAFVGGDQVEKFEEEFAAFCEVRHAIGVANGTDALLLALKALAIGPDDEVITAANSFVATAEAIVHSGAKPVFVDIDPDTYNIDVNQIESHITPRTKAIIPVHLYGQPADMQQVLEIAHGYGLRVIEDAAQGHGARYHGRRAGSMGDVACFSFYPAKNLGACGDAGAVVTSDDEIATAVRKLRDHGGLRKYDHDMVGYNSRLDGLQAAILKIKLKDLEQRNEIRRRRAQTYSELLSGIEGIVTPFEPDGTTSVYHLYVIRIDKGSRNGLKNHLNDHGVQTGIHYPVPIHRTRAFARFKSSSCPVAEEYAARILSLPMYPEIETQQMEYVATLISDYMNEMSEQEAGSKWST